MKAIYANIVSNTSQIGCPNECSTWDVHYNIDAYNKDAFYNSGLDYRSRKNVGNVWMKLLSDTVEVHQEIEVYDLSSIVGSVGGSLGLFVGFSVLQCLLDCYDKLERKLDKLYFKGPKNAK